MIWPIVRLDSVAFRGSGHTPSQKHPEYWDGGVKWVSLADSPALDKRYIYETAKTISPLGIRHSSAVLHPKGTVIVSRDAGVGKSAILGDDMAVSQHFIAWQCDEKRLHREYLYQWLQSHKLEFERIAAGSTVKTIGLAYFEKLCISLPPIDIQQEVAAMLSEWDAAIDRTERLISAKEKRLESVTGKLYVLSSEKGGHSHFGAFLKESSVVGTNGRHARKLSIKLYGKGVVAKDDNRTGSEQTKYFVRRCGQLVYSKLDFLNGAFGIVPAELDGYESTLDLPAFDIDDSTVDPDWLLGYLTRPIYYTRQTGLARGQRKARRVHPSDFLAAHLKLPPLAVQRQVAAALRALKQDIAATKSLRNAYKAQKRGLMQKLLTGEWRVDIPKDAAYA